MKDCGVGFADGLYIFIFFRKHYPKRKGDKMKNDKDNEIFAAASAAECTGLIPGGGNHTLEEIDNYRDIYPFALPAKKKDGKAVFKNEK